MTMKRQRRSRSTFTELRRLGWLAAKWLRVAVYLMVVCSVVTLLGMRSARGSIGEAALGVGRQLSELADLTGGAYRVELNGEPIQVASAVVDAPIGVVLDRFEAVCERHSAVPKLMQEPASVADASLPISPDSGALRRESEREGMIACLARPNGGESFTERVRRFGETLDLNEIGLLRFAYVQRTKNGKSHVVTAWTSGPFSLASFTGEAGKDAPGTDPEHAVRPSASTRLFSARIVGSPHAVRIYTSSEAPEQVLSSYDAAMRKREFSKVDLPDAPTTRAFVSKRADVLVMAERDSQGTVITVIESPNGRQAPAEPGSR